GSAKVPRRVKVLLTLILAVGMCPAVKAPPNLNDLTTWQLAVGIGGEIIFGFAMGMVLSFVFIAGQWAGELIGQQMGLNMSEVFDPQFGQAGSLVGDMYFMLTLVIFLSLRGHHAILDGVRASFDALPLLSVGMNKPLFGLLTGLFTSCTTLAIQLAGPMIVTMLVVDLALGAISKTMPQINVMTAGLTMRSLVGLVVLIVGISLTARVIEKSLNSTNGVARQQWSQVKTQ
ncbi:MAG TPA: flagellar biosynthetic protein FliR, partial [Tepidisphaeraceae bacterium]|nr:flagellar biosynthetic protein FliR [Tepidisphaeraceae bacterium]